MNIRRIAIVTIALALFAVAQAQDTKSNRQSLTQDEAASTEADENSSNASDSESPEEGPAADEDEAEEEATESGTYKEEDGFIPTEDVSADQSLRFPVDI